VFNRRFLQDHGSPFVNFGKLRKPVKPEGAKSVRFSKNKILEQLAWFPQRPSGAQELDPQGPDVVVLKKFFQILTFFKKKTYEKSFFILFSFFFFKTLSTPFFSQCSKSL